MSRSYRKRPIYSDKDLKFGTGIKNRGGEVVDVGTLIPAKRKINHFEAEVADARALKHVRRNRDEMPRYIPKISEE